jgi:hypothetical protein
MAFLACCVTGIRPSSVGVLCSNRVRSFPAQCRTSGLARYVRIRQRWSLLGYQINTDCLSGNKSLALIPTMLAVSRRRYARKLFHSKQNGLM